MSNPFELITQKLDTLLLEVESIKRARTDVPNFLPLSEYCIREGVTRPTCYNRAARGLIQLQKFGGRQYVKIDSIQAVGKYHRATIQ
jgi:hypothetical protein